jgi:NitT/TauT family transport system substrate-binding protein
MKTNLHKHSSITGATGVRTLVGALIVILIGSSAWWYLSKRPQPGSTPGPQVIRVAYAPVVLNLPSYVAEDKGLFESRGLKPEYVSFSSANDMINALVAGQVDVVTGVSLVPILNLEAQFPGKARVFLHSMMTAATPYDGLVVKADSPIQGLSDLSGKKVGVFPGTTSQNLLKATLVKHGVDVTSVQFVPLPPPSHLSALESGSVDALLAYEPTLSTALHEGARQVFGSIFAELLSPSPISSSVASRKFVADQPEVFAKFVAALDEAILLIQAKPEECRQSLLSHTKITPEVVAKVNLVPDVISTELKPEVVQAFADLLQSIGELPKRVDAKALMAP